MIFGIKKKIYNFDPYHVFLAIATNIPQRFKTGFVVQGHICWFGAQETFLIRNVEKVVLLNTFVKNCDHFFFFQDYLIIEGLKEQHLFQIEILRNNLMKSYVIAVTFDRFNTSFLNTRINFVQKLTQTFELQFIEDSTCLCSSVLFCKCNINIICALQEQAQAICKVLSTFFDCALASEKSWGLFGSVPVLPPSLVPSGGGGVLFKSIWQKCWNLSLFGKC